MYKVTDDLVYLSRDQYPQCILTETEIVAMRRVRPQGVMFVTPGVQPENNYYKVFYCNKIYYNNIISNNYCKI